LDQFAAPSMLLNIGLLVRSEPWVSGNSTESVDQVM
jgi:hypothetical protein